MYILNKFRLQLFTVILLLVVNVFMSAQHSDSDPVWSMVENRTIVVASQEEQDWANENFNYVSSKTQTVGYDDDNNRIDLIIKKNEGERTGKLLYRIDYVGYNTHKVVEGKNIKYDNNQFYDFYADEANKGKWCVFDTLMLDFDNFNPSNEKEAIFGKISTIGTNNVLMVACDGEKIFIATESPTGEKKFYYAAPRIFIKEGVLGEAFSRRRKIKWNARVRRKYEEHFMKHNGPPLFVAKDNLSIALDFPFAWYQVTVPRLNFINHDGNKVFDEVIDIGVGYIPSETPHYKKYRAEQREEAGLVVQDGIASFDEGIATFYLLVKRTIYKKDGSEDVSYTVRWIDEQMYNCINNWDSMEPVTAEEKADDDGDGFKNWQEGNLWRTATIKEGGWMTFNDYYLDLTSPTINDVVSSWYGGLILALPAAIPLAGELSIIATSFIGYLFVAVPELSAFTTILGLISREFLAIGWALPPVLSLFVHTGMNTFLALGLALGLTSSLVLGLFIYADLNTGNIPSLAFHVFLLATLLWTSVAVPSILASQTHCLQARIWKKKGVYQKIGETVDEQGNVTPIYEEKNDFERLQEAWWDPYDKTDSSGSLILGDNSRIDVSKEHIILIPDDPESVGKIYTIANSYWALDKTWRARNLPNMDNVSDSLSSTFDDIELYLPEDIRISSVHESNMYIIIRGKILNGGESTEGYFIQPYLNEDNDFEFPEATSNGTVTEFPAQEDKWLFINEDDFINNWQSIHSTAYMSGTKLESKGMEAAVRENSTGPSVRNVLINNNIKYVSKIEDTKSLDFILSTSEVKTLPFTILSFFPELKIAFSINGSTFVDAVCIEDITGYDNLEDYETGILNGDVELSNTQLVYNKSGYALLASPTFKEGYNNLTLRLTDIAERNEYRQLDVMQLVVPPFLKPDYPKRNEFINESSFTGKIIVDHITGDTTMPENWFENEETEIIVTIDGNPQAVEKHVDTNTVTFDVDSLEDGNHVVNVEIHYFGATHGDGWTFWVDTTGPEIKFPERIIFNNTNDAFQYYIACSGEDKTEFKINDEVSIETDTVILKKLEYNVTEDGSPIGTILSKNNTGMGTHIAPWNGQINGSKLAHGMYGLEVAATDRVNNTAVESTDLIIDNLPPVLNSISLNQNFVNSNSDPLILKYNLGLDNWEEKGKLFIEIENIETAKNISFPVEGENNTDTEYAFSFINNQVNLIKDGMYEIKVHTGDDIDNKGETVSLGVVTIDLTKPHYNDVSLYPFVLKDDDSSIRLKFTVDENEDAECNKSSDIDVNVKLFDDFGNILNVFPEYKAIPDVEFNQSILLPVSLSDGKYFLEITIRDKNGNESIETAAFIKNATPPEITYPAENEMISGITTLYGNIYDPKWDNNYDFDHYELFYISGIYDVPENLAELSSAGWLNDNIFVPQYQRNPDWDDSYGLFTVENENLIGSLDTEGMSNGDITVLLVAVEENGYRIGAVKHYRIENTAVSENIIVEISPEYKSDFNADFRFTENVNVTYDIKHEFNNPVDVYSFVKDQDGKIIKRDIYYDLKSNDIKGTPVIEESEKGLFVYQDNSDRMHVILKNNNDLNEESAFLLTLKSEKELTDFTTGSGTTVEILSAEAEGYWNYPMMKNLQPGESYEIIFNMEENSELTLFVLADNALCNIYAGQNKRVFTTGSITLYEGSDYPPVKWDGKDILSRYVENGIYTIGVEAYGKSGGKGEDTCQIEIKTPLLIESVDVINFDIQPGVSTLDYCLVKILGNKPGYITAEIFNSDEDLIKTITTTPISERGYISFEWYADNEIGLPVPEGDYNIKITFYPLDNSEQITIDKTTHEILGSIKVITPKILDESITAKFNGFEKTGDYEGEEVIKGDSKYQVIVDPEGQYLPDRDVKLVVEAEGTNVVEAYPDMNYMAAVRAIYTQLKGEVQITKINFKTKYKNIWDTDYKTYSPGTNFKTNKVILSYKDDNAVPNPDLNYTINGYVDFSVTKWSKGNMIWDPEFNSVTGADVASYNISKGSRYTGTAKPSVTVTSYQKRNYDPNPLVGTFTLRCYITIKGKFQIKSDFDIDKHYLACCDSIAAIGPDVPDDDLIYTHNAGYVNMADPQGKIIDYLLIDDNIDNNSGNRTNVSNSNVSSTGMTPADLRNVWRINPEFYLYFIGDEYNNNISDDNATIINDDTAQLGDYSVGNYPDDESFKIIPELNSNVKRIKLDFENYESQVFHSGKVNFSIKRELTDYSSYKNDKIYITIESSAEDRLNYPFPADKNEFEEGHSYFEGDNTIFINSNGKSDYISNYYVPEYKYGSNDIKNVYFDGEIDNIVEQDIILKYNYGNESLESGYKGNISRIELYNIFKDKYPQTHINIKEWRVNSIISENVNFNFPESIPHGLDDYVINDSHIAGVENVKWKLENDPNIVELNKKSLVSEREDISDYYDRLKRYGIIKNVTISGYYPFTADMSDDLYSMYQDQTVDNSNIIIDPYTRNYAGNAEASTFGKYNVQLLGLDNKVYKGLAVTDESIVYFGKGNKLSDGFTIKATDESPHRLLAVMGEVSEGVEISLSYSEDEINWNDIPIYNSEEGIITYWDITGLCGLYTIRLICMNDDSYNMDFKKVYIGELIKADGDGEQTVQSANGEAKIIIPENAVTEDVVINVDSMDMDDIKDIAVLPDIAPVGKVVKFSPDGYEFNNDVYPQIEFTYSNKDISDLNIDARDIIIYHLKKNGELVKLNSFVEVFKNDKIIWDNDTNSKEDDIPDYGDDGNTENDYDYVRVWSYTTHFSYYTVLEGDVNEKPSLDQTDFTTGNTIVELTGSGKEGETLEFFIGDNLLYMKQDSTDVVSSVTIEENGTFSFENIELPYEGENYIFIGYAGNVNKQYAKIIITRDTESPVINVKDFYKYISPDGNGKYDNVNISITSGENTAVSADIIDKDTGILQYKKSFNLLKDKEYIWKVDGIYSNENILNDGIYTIKFYAEDYYGNSTVIAKELIVDTAAAEVFVNNADGIISPENMDGLFDTAEIDIEVSEKSIISLLIKDQHNTDIRHLITKSEYLPGDITLNWDGKNEQGNYVPDGIYLISQHTEDPAGNIFEDVFTENKIVVDNTPPAVFPDFDNGELFFVPEILNFNFKASEECSLKFTVYDENNIIIFESETQFIKGVNQIEWNAGDNLEDGVYNFELNMMDNAGNISSCNVLIEISHDNMPPVLTVPDDIVKEYEDILTTVSIGEATAIDDSPPVTIMNDAPDAYPLGTTVVTWTAVDSLGNKSAATQNITISDTAAPVIGNVDDLVLEQESPEGTEYILSAPEVTDLADPDPSIINDAPAVFPAGKTVVTWTASDSSGNLSTVQQKVTVVDTTPPVFIEINDITLEQEGPGGTKYILTLPQIKDAADPDPVLTNDAPAVFPAGKTVVTWTAEDSSGNISYTEQVVIVQDTIGPELEVKASRKILYPPNHGFKHVFFQYSAIDAVSGDVSNKIKLEYVTSDEEADKEENKKYNKRRHNRHHKYKIDSDGHTKEDIKIIRNWLVLVRAERDYEGDGRVYTFHFTVTDKAGNITAVEKKVEVRLFIYKAAIDSGESYRILNESKSCKYSNKDKYNLLKKNRKYE